MTKISYFGGGMQKISLDLNASGDCRVPERWQLREPLHMQRLYYIKGGRGWFEAPDGKRTDFLPGKLYLHPFNLTDTFGHDPADPLDHLYFDFTSTPPIISPAPLCFDVPEGSPLRLQLAAVERYLADCTALPSHSYSKPRIGFTAHRQIMTGFLELLLLLLSTEHPLPFTDDSAVIDTLEHIRLDYASPLTVSDLAAQAGFELNYFIRRFRSVMGVTPYAYLRSWRLLKARELLSGGCTVARAAELVGYENASSLSRALHALPRGDI